MWYLTKYINKVLSNQERFEYFFGDCSSDDGVLGCGCIFGAIILITVIGISSLITLPIDFILSPIYLFIN
jgi:hypothetical protein